MATALWNGGSLLWRNFAVTAEEVALGLGMALAGGFALAVAIHLSPLLRRAVYPLAVGSQAVPIPVIGVLLVFWWGFGIFPKLVVIALICFFPVLVTTVDGLAAVDPDQLKLMRTLDASRWQAFRFAELPAALPAALSGARIALAVGVIGAFIAEMATPTTGPLPGARPRDHDRRQLPDTARVRRHGDPDRLRHRLLLHTGAGRAQAGPMEPPTSRRHPVSIVPARPARAILPALALIACAFALAACGSKQDVLSAKSSKRFTVMLDFFPNADHAALYSAIAHGDFRAVGLDVVPETPADPAEPLKLLAAGRVDMAISYEPELLLARDQGLKLVSIGALVQRPLTSIIALPGKHVASVADLAGKRVGTAGIPYQAAELHTALRTRRRQAGLGP